MRTIIEPFKINSVEPIRMTSRDEREAKLRARRSPETILNLWERRATGPGYRFVEQAPIQPARHNREPQSWAGTAARIERLYQRVMAGRSAP